MNGEKISISEPQRLTKWHWAFLGAVFIIGLAVRLVGIRFGKPLLTHPDEAFIINPVLSMSQRLSLNPMKFAWPAHILYKLDFIFLNLMSYLHYGRNLRWFRPEDLIVLYYAARVLSAFFGAGIPLTAFFIGRQFKPDFSITAAVIFAFFPAFVIHAHYITPDTYITLYTLLVILFCLRYLNTGKRAFLLLALFFVAVNTADKYPGLISFGIVIVTLIIASIHTESNTKQKRDLTVLKQSLICLVIFVVFLFIVAPHLFLELPAVTRALKIESRTSDLGSDGLGFLGNLTFYIKDFSTQANLLLILFFGAGMYGLIKTRQVNAILLLYGFGYWTALSVLALHQSRWGLPMYTAPLLIAAFGISYVATVLKPRTNMHRLAVALASICLLCVFVAGLSSSTYMGLPDTQAASLDYCHEQGIPPKDTLYEGYTPFAPGGIVYEIYDYDWDEEDWAQYAILSSLMYGRYFAEPERVPDKIAFYDALFQNASLIKEFQPEPQPKNFFERLDLITYYLSFSQGKTESTRFSGPTIKIYKLD